MLDPVTWWTGEKIIKKKRIELQRIQVHLPTPQTLSQEMLRSLEMKLPLDRKNGLSESYNFAPSTPFWFGVYLGSPSHRRIEAPIVSFSRTRIADDRHRDTRDLISDFLKDEEKNFG
ncbi:unnamed protein product [Allacma fusca]|uniref:Uncharacterized protein n=1 Tax=Allacma fusca TaxID=39272 RepID=A0A8J2LJK6_9HEXA|nr:unnamed protein product [Allacma fusca]